MIDDDDLGSVVEGWVPLGGNVVLHFNNDVSCAITGGLSGSYTSINCPYEITPSGDDFVGQFICEISGESFDLVAEEKPAVERGMRHFTYAWANAIQNLRIAGLKQDELAGPLAIIRPRIAEAAWKECQLELGVRQSEKKAKDLLLMCLTPEQQAEFAKHHRFTIHVEHELKGFPKGEFRIAKGSAFNVTHVKSKEQFCLVARERVPVYDQMLTQKLLLENDPARFFKTANRSGGYADDGVTMTVAETVWASPATWRLRGR